MNTKKPRFCRRCGIELHDFGPNQRLCDDCCLILRSCGEDQLLHLSRVADWAGMTYGKFMAKPPVARAALIAAYDRHHAE